MSTKGHQEINLNAGIVTLVENVDITASQMNCLMKMDVISYKLLPGWKKI